MDFKSLTGTRGTEVELERLIVEKTQANFDIHKGETCYFFKLASVEGGAQSEILWVREYPSLEEMIRYFKSGPKQKSCIMLKFERDYYETYCHGFQRNHRLKIWFDHMEDSCGPPDEGDPGVEKWDQPDWELVEKGFGEISMAVSNSPNLISIKFKKAV